MRVIQKASGQTLIEVLITALIIAAAVIALIRFQNYLAFDNSLTKQRAEATTLAVQKIESLRDFQMINTTSGFNAYADIVNGTQTTTIGNTSYTVAWTITTTATPAYKTIDVTVSWTDRRSATQSVRITTRVGSIDPANSAAIM